MPCDVQLSVIYFNESVKWANGYSCILHYSQLILIQVIERDSVYKQNSREIKAKIEKTKKTQEVLLRDFEDHMKEINKHKVWRQI